MRELYLKLREAYSEKNLNRITGELIILYKAKDFSQIRHLAGKVSKYVSIEDVKISKCFSKLIMLYHPDKGQAYRESIETLFSRGDKDKLEEFSHIFLIGKLEPSIYAEIDEDIGYEPEYEWDPPGSGYRYFSDTEDADIMETIIEFGGTFYEAIKMRIYGNLSQELPSHYLEDIEDVEMADSQIELLDGIEHCEHVVYLDLSGNLINNISSLWSLELLEELCLANNDIGYIDALCNLVRLREVDLSDNNLDDITPLLGLKNLEFVNLLGNKIPEEQVLVLRAKGILVLY